MASAEKRRIVIEDQDKRTEGTLDISAPSGTERATRAALTLGCGLLMTAPFVFVPILHFFLVPFGVLLSVLSTRRALKTASYITGGGGPCPACGVPVRILPRRDEQVFSDLCEGCKRAVTVRQIA